MRRDKTAGRILLILSVVHVGVAAPAIVCQRSLDVAEDVTPASEKRGNSDGDSSKDLYPVPQMDSDLPTTSGTPPTHNDPPISGATPSQDNTSPASGDPQVHHDPLAGSGDPQHGDPYRWWEYTNWRPAGEIVQGESSSQLELGAPQLKSDPPPASGAPPLHDDPPPPLHDDPPSTLGTQPVHDDAPLGSGEFDDSWRWLNDLRHVEGAPPSSHPESEASMLHSESEAPMLHMESEAPSLHMESEESAPTSEASNFLSDALKQRLKTFAGYGAVAGVSAGLTLGVQKLISHESYVSAFFHSSPADI